MKIEIKKPKKEDMEKEGVMSWPIWEKEVSRFDWFYDSIEECYLLEGQVVVETEDGETVEFGKGDFVTFPKGLTCIWDIKVPVK
ncbi:cupin domain-containing protein, partial [bacterium]|nr:cupin domain-containing protein [bacterium]